MVLLMFRKVRESRSGLIFSSVMVILGFAANRMNTAITGMESWPTMTYFPSWQEIMSTLGIATLGFVAFYYIAKYFPVFPKENASGSHQQFGKHDDLVSLNELSVNVNN